MRLRHVSSLREPICLQGHTGIHFLGVDGNVVIRTIKNSNGDIVHYPHYAWNGSDLFFWEDNAICRLVDGVAVPIVELDLPVGWHHGRLAAERSFVAITAIGGARSYTLSGQLIGEWPTGPVLFGPDGQPEGQMDSRGELGEIAPRIYRGRLSKAWDFDYSSDSRGVMLGASNVATWRFSSDPRKNRRWRFGLFEWIWSVSFVKGCVAAYVGTEIGLNKYFRLYRVEEGARKPTLVMTRRRPIHGPFYEGKEALALAATLGVDVNRLIFRTSEGSWGKYEAHEGPFSASLVP